MSYLVFARKWRPNTFHEVVGQEHVTQTLMKAIEKDRVAHAYIFTGTRGVGKTTLARILARALNCDKGPTPNPCGECESCKTILSGSSFDVLEIDGASNNSVEDIRELRENIGYSSMAGKHRIYVIDEVHMLSKAAFNALLKTLEEPPPKVIFIFATTEPHKIPQTIQSRCQRFDFRRISNERIYGQLAKICTAEKLVCDRPGLELIARKADGSMRDALSLLDQVFSYGKDSFTEADVRSILGVVGTDIYKSIFTALADRNPAPVLEAVQNVLTSGLDLAEFVTGLEEFIRDLLFAHLPGLADPDGSGTAGLAPLAEHFTEQTLLRMSEIAKKGEQELRYSSFPRFCVESLLLKLVYLDDTVSLEKLLRHAGGSRGTSLSEERSDAVKKKITLPPEPTVTIQPKPEEPPPPPQEAPGEPVPDLQGISNDSYPENEGETAPNSVAEDSAETFDSDSRISLSSNEETWPHFMQKLVEDWPRLGTMLSAATIVAIKGSTIELRFGANYQFQFGEVSNLKNRDHIQKELAAYFGKPIDLHMTLEPKQHPLPAAGTPLAATPVQKGSIQDDIEREPIIQSVLELFDGEVLD